MKHSFADIHRLMESCSERAAAEGQPFVFPFTASAVAQIYTYKKRHGPGLWFCLNDSRIFNSRGYPDNQDITLYTAFD